MWKRILNATFIKFFLVGGLNTLFAYSCFVLVIYFGIYYPFAVVISTIIGVFFNFKTTGKFVFNNSKNSLLFKFIGVYTVTCLANIIFLRIFEIFNFNIYYAGAFLALPMALLAFILNKKFVFRNEQQ